MIIVAALIALFGIYAVWKLFVDGWLFKIILFFAGWIGLFVLMRVYVEGSQNIAITISGTSFTWSAVVPTIVCVMCLLCTRVQE